MRRSRGEAEREQGGGKKKKSGKGQGRASMIQVTEEGSRTLQLGRALTGIANSEIPPNKAD